MYGGGAFKASQVNIGADFKALGKAYALTVAGRKGVHGRRWAEPPGGASAAGARMIDWSPADAAIDLGEERGIPFLERSPPGQVEELMAPGVGDELDAHGYRSISAAQLEALLFPAASVATAQKRSLRADVFGAGHVSDASLNASVGRRRVWSSATWRRPARIRTVTRLRPLSSTS